MEDEPEPTGVVALRQPDPANDARFSFAERQGVEFAPPLTGLVDEDTSLLTDDKVPAPALRLTQQRHTLKACVSDDPDLTLRGDQRQQEAEQGDLLPVRDMSLPSSHHFPDQGQGPLAIGQANQQQAMVKTHLRAVSHQANLPTCENAQQLFSDRPIPIVSLASKAVTGPHLVRRGRRKRNSGFGDLL
jgi:hypothetical protein